MSGLPRAPALAACLLLLALHAPPALAGVAIEAEREAVVTLPEEAREATVRVPFRLTTDGAFYAKLLPTPWNPVNDGSGPNGTPGGDGWWIAFTLLDAAGAPVSVDADGAPVDAALGAFVDDSPTRAVALPGETPFLLEARVHVPDAARDAAAPHRVPFALVHRSDAGGGGNGTSGASLDESRGFTLTIATGAGGGADPAPVPDEAGSGAPAPGDAPADPADSGSDAPPPPKVGLLVVLTLAFLGLALGSVPLVRWRLRGRRPGE